MFDSLNADVLNQISSIEQVRAHASAGVGLIEINDCLKAAARECRSASGTKLLSELEIQQIERGLLAAQRISAKAFEKQDL